MAVVRADKQRHRLRRNMQHVSELRPDLSITSVI